MASTQVAEAEVVAVELFRTPEGRTDPYPRYHRLRELDPVHRSETVKSWLLSRYDDCHSAVRDPRLGKDFAERMDAMRPWWRDRPSHSRFEHSMLNVDGPYHTRLRRLVSKTFTFRSVEALKPAIERTVDELLEPLAEAGEGDLLEGLAFPLPVTVIGELLGVPSEDRAQFRPLVAALTEVFEPARSYEQFDAADEAQNVIDDYFYSLVGEKRAHPTDDLLSGLIHAGKNDDGLTDTELVTLATLLFAAGFETTTNLLGNGMLGLLHQPDQIELLRERPELYASLSDEILRFDGTAQMLSRQVKEDFEIDGRSLHAGETVTILLGAGNHDPARYADPDRIDVTRTEIRPLSFGGGVHFCLGAALARAEIEIAFRMIFERFPSLQIGGEAAFRDRLALRGLSSLPLRFSTATPARSVAPVMHRGPAAPETPTAPRSDEPSATLPPRPVGAADAVWRAAYRAEMERQPIQRSQGEVAATLELLGRIPLFSGCTPAELERLATTAYAISFDPMDVLCAQGLESPECYVISEGEAIVTMDGEVVATVGSDDVVGEKGPIEDKPRAATVTATTHMVTYAISKAELHALLDRSPAAAAAMRAELTRRYG